MKSIDELKDYYNYGNKVKYLFFWGHTPKSEGVVDKSCFSQWFGSSFEEDGVVFQSAEHYMMAKKALLFGDNDIYKSILDAKNPGEAKKLGRAIKNFNEDIWLANRFQIVVDGNVLKFGQNEALGEYLLGTSNRVLVEASPVDRIWGIGMDQNNNDCENPNLWKGLNLLGFALMVAREILQAGKAS